MYVIFTFPIWLRIDSSKDQQEEEDDKLMEEYYIKFKSSAVADKYKLIPKFYSRVSFCTLNFAPNV